MQQVFLEELPPDAPPATEYNSDEPPPDLRLELCRGARVRIHGLTKAADFNGRTGVVDSEGPNGGRWTIKVDQTEKRFKLRPGNLTVIAAPAPPDGTEGASTHEQKAFVQDDAHSEPDFLRRLHRISSCGIFGNTRKGKGLYGIVFDYLDIDWRNKLTRCNPKRANYRVEFAVMVDGQRDQWVNFVRRLHRLSNRGLKQVYDELRVKRQKHSNLGRTELFGMMKEAMVSEMKKMVRGLNHSMKHHLKKVWEIYADKKESTKISMNKFKSICRDNLIVEFNTADKEHADLIVEQAVINAVKPLEVMEAPDPNIIENQKKIARQSVLDSKDTIIHQHLMDIEKKLANPGRYIKNLFRDMDISNEESISWDTFEKKYLPARANLREEGENLQKQEGS